MKLLSVVLGASIFVGALALSRSSDTLEIQNANSPQRGNINKISQTHEATSKSKKPKSPSAKNRIDDFTKPRSCSNQRWFCEDDDRCRYCNGVCKIREGKEYGKCVDAPKPPSCSEYTQYCESFIQCADCDGICQIEDGEETGVCVDKPKRCTDLYTDCKTSEDCGFCGGFCDILDGERFGLCIDREEGLGGKTRSSSKIVIVITQ
ncbi:hypothetical protein TWF730_009712 [Orbilia blumenaviensis]|uniref:Uncharacterized protein n=1 Tax=Orbilia blumenaviensis TaxID=1796055 RepID=A0AAV9UW46_9PEZI